MQLEVVHAEPVARGAFGLEADLHILALVDDSEVEGVVLHHRDGHLRQSGIEVSSLLSRASIDGAAAAVLLDVESAGCEAIAAFRQFRQHLRDAYVAELLADGDPRFEIIGTRLTREDGIILGLHAMDGPARRAIRFEGRVLDAAGEVGG